MGNIFSSPAPAPPPPEPEMAPDGQVYEKAPLPTGAAEACAGADDNSATDGPGPLHAPAQHLNYSKYISDLAQNWPLGSIRGLFRPDQLGGKISLAGGLPASVLFAFKGLTIRVPDREDGSTLTSLTVDSKVLGEALQYGPADGLGVLRDWVMHHTARAHNRPVYSPPAKGQTTPHTPWGVAFGAGIQDVIDKVFKTLLNKGDTILVEAPTYPGVLPCILTIGADPHPVPTDAGGLSSTGLAATLANWHTSAATKHKRFPKAIYTVPVGGNPSGTSATAARKRDVLALTRQYGVLIIEDDPYYYLAFDQGLGTADPVTRTRTTSYLSLEQEDVDKWGDGRVVRLDSFSKIVSAGMRVGYVTAPQDIIEALETVGSASSMQASGPAAAMTATLLQYWGEEGFLRSCDRAALFYRHKRDVFERLAAEVLTDAAGTQLATWVSPAAGMFLWLKLRLPPTPDSPDGDAHAFIQYALERGVVAVPGFLFFPDQRTSPYVRAAFSQVAEADMHTGLTRLKLAVQDAWKDAGLKP